MKEKNKKKITKKSIDIESEFVGTPVAPAQKKEKKCDLTDEIRKFLSETINLETIKRILLRLRGPISEQELIKSKIIVYGFPSSFNNQIEICEFLISIETKKRKYKYFLGIMLFFSLDFFNKEKIDNSFLKQNLAHALRKWFSENLDQITILPS